MQRLSNQINQSMMRDEEPKYKELKLFLVILAVVLAALRFVLLPISSQPPRAYVPTAADSLKVATVLHDSFDDYFIKEKWKKQTKSGLQVLIPNDFNFLNYYQSLIKSLNPINAEILSCVESRGESYALSVGMYGQPIQSITFVFKENLMAQNARAAIIIDDFGYKYNSLIKNFISFEHPITLSILPGLKETVRIAREAYVVEKEVMLHMPMEPLNVAFDKGEFLLQSGVEAPAIRIKLDEMFKLVPNAVGINNHQGSKSTADPELMNMFMQEYRDYRKIFIDSRTNQKSVAYSVAKRYNIKAGQNNLFLDAKDETAFIRQQMNRLASQVQKNKSVIAIGHPRKKTFQVLSEMVPQLESSGIEFVYVSQLF